MTVRTSELTASVACVEQHFHHLLDQLELMRDRLLALFDLGAVDSEQARSGVEPLACAMLAASDIVGAGYVAARGALSDQALYLAWWQGEDQHLLAESGAPATGAPLDYTRHPWFRTPERTGLPHVTGPYVDFVCTDEYVITSTVPVVSHQRMVGVVGADTLVETFEGLMMPTLRAAGATVVNDLGRTVVSSDPHLATGCLLDLDGCREVVACKRLPLSVVRT